MHLDVDCGFPDETILNGHVDTSNGTIIGSTATYTCNTGYSLSGSQLRKCGADRNWTSTAPVCRGKPL